MHLVRNITVALVVGGLLVFLAGCPNPTSSDDDSGGGGGGTTDTLTVSGVVRDAVTGDPVENVVVSLEGVGSDTSVNATQTDAAGAFSLQFDGVTTVTRDVYIFKGTEYTFRITESATFDESTGTGLEIYLEPAVPAAGVTISGEAEGATANAFMKIVVMNSNGGVWSDDTEDSLTVDETNDTYSMTTPTTGADAAIAVLYSPDENASPPSFYARLLTAQDLTGGLSLDVGASHGTYETVSITNADSEDLVLFSMDLEVSGYGTLPAVVQGELPVDSTGSFEASGFSGTNVILTAATENDTPSGDVGWQSFNYGSSEAYSTSLTVPAPASGLTLESAVDGSQAGFDSATGEVTFQTLPEADGYRLDFESDERDSGAAFADGGDGSIFALPETTLGSFPLESVASDSSTNWDVTQIAIEYSNNNLRDLVDFREGGFGPLWSDASLRFAQNTDSSSTPNAAIDLIP